MTAWVVDLRDEAAGDRALVGGKAAALNRLIRAGMPVPAAIVVTTEAFRPHFPGATPVDVPARPRMQAALVEAIADALDARFDAHALLAVRSSAPDEDGAAASFAGQHATYYYIEPKAVPEAVTDCWLSLWSAEARGYRAGHGRNDDPLSMAVIVQRMVQAESSGVCFTSDPTGRCPEEVWIEATWGLGAALVDGRVSPDRWLLDRSGTVLRRQLGRKRHQVAAEKRRPRETRLEPVPLSRQTEPALSEQQVREVLRCSLEAERLCGGPQDVEWAYEDGTLHLLQSRPITTIGGARAGSRTEAGPFPDGRWVLFKPLAENFTEPLTPMTVDLLSRVLPPGGRFIDGRYYLSLETAERLCPFRWSADELTDVLLLRGDVPRLDWNWRKAPLAGLGLAIGYLADGIAWQRTAHLTRDSLVEYALLCDRLRGAGAPDAVVSLQRLVLGGHAFEPIGRVAYYVNVSAGRYFLLLGILNKLMDRYAGEFDRHSLSQLVSGDGSTFSRRLVEGVRILADVARKDTELAARLSDGEVRGLAEALGTLPSDHPFVLALESFLAVFGHRCVREMELAQPRWREDPLPLLSMVRGYLRGPSPPARDLEALRTTARDTLRRALPQRWQRHLADYLIRRIRYYTSLREDSRHYHAMAMDVIRGKLLDLEQSLLTDGRLRLAGDLFYLTWEEARALATRRLTWHDVAEHVRHRRRRERALTRAGAPQTFGLTASHAGPGPESMGASTTSILTGQCASPGWAEGRVRIVLDPGATSLEPGDILVAPYTDPAWTPLFPLAGAVIVEVGSFLSHAGTVAREYGIPCLVDVVDCTRRLREGQRVRVLASEGRVEVIYP